MKNKKSQIDYSLYERHIWKKPFFIFLGIVILLILIILIFSLTDNNLGISFFGENAKSVSGITKQAGESIFDSSGWISWAKDSHNSRIADDEVAPPFKAGWDVPLTGEENYDFPMATRLYYQDDTLVAVAPFKNPVNARCIYAYNATTGESLWTNFCGGVRGSRGMYVIGNDFVYGANDHAGAWKEELNTGEKWEMGQHSAPGLTASYANIDKEGIYTMGIVCIDCGANYVKAIDAVYEPLAKHNDTGKLNGAHEFFGPYITKDYLNLGNKLNPGTKNLTIMFWLKPDENYLQYLLIKGNRTKGDFDAKYKIRYLSGYVTYALEPVLYNAMFGGTSFNCSIGEWCHFALTYDHQKEKLYKNGQLVFQRDNTKDIGSDDNPLYIGGFRDYGSYDGMIDETAVFNRALSESEIQSMYNSEISVSISGLQLLLHFNNDSAHNENNSFIYDYSGNGNNAIYDGHINEKIRWSNRVGSFVDGIPSGEYAAWSGGGQLAQEGGILYVPNGILYAFNASDGLIKCPLQTEDRFGNPNQAYLFKKDSSYYYFHNSINLKNGITMSNSSSPKSISFWIYSDELDSGTIFGSKNDSDSNKISLSGDWTYFYVPGVYWSNFNTSQSPVAKGKWYHIVLTRNGNTWELFKNGISLGTKTSSKDLFIETIGKACTADFCDIVTDNFNGKIDDIRVYNGTLTTQEIINLNNSLEISSLDLLLKMDFSENMQDLSGNGNSGSCEGGWSLGVKPVEAVTGDISYLSEVTYSDGFVYVVGRENINSPPAYWALNSSDWKKAKLYKINATNGELILGMELPDYEFSEMKGFFYPFEERGEPAFKHIVENNRAYVSQIGKTIAYNTLTGEKIWEYNHIAKGDIQNIILSGNIIYTIESGRTDYEYFYPNLVLLDKNTGEVIYKYSLIWNDRIMGMIIVDNKLFLSGSSKRVYVLEPGYESPQIINSGVLISGSESQKYPATMPDALAFIGPENAIKIKNGEGPFTWEVIHGQIPQGLSLQNFQGTNHVYLTGTPTQAGDSSFTLKATDSRGNSDEKEFSLVILPNSRINTIVLQDNLSYDLCEDSMIDIIKPNKNYGNETISLGYGYGIGETYPNRYLIKFKIFQSEGGLVPDDAIIVSANLSLYKIDSYLHNVTAYKLLKNWSEMEVTWNKSSANEIWVAMGANETYFDRSEENLNFLTQNYVNGKFFNTPDWYNIDLSSFLVNYKPGMDNNGWIMQKPGYNLKIYTCDYINTTTGDISLRPKLTIQYKKYSANAKPPVVDVKMNPAIAVFNKTITIDASQSNDPDGEIVSVKWSGISCQNPNSTKSLICNVSADRSGNCQYCEQTPIPTQYQSWCDNYYGQIIDPFYNYSYCINYTKVLELNIEDDYGYYVTKRFYPFWTISFDKTTITTTMLKKGEVNQLYSDYVYVGGSSGNSWSLIGSLPA
ncbi:MAG: LamG-like jellyroll fold domain-containing protein, partial [Candidatus Pacearchaeota archaeon]